MGPHNNCLASLAHFTVLIYPRAGKSRIQLPDLISNLIASRFYSNRTFPMAFSWISWQQVGSTTYCPISNSPGTYQWWPWFHIIVTDWLIQYLGFTVLFYYTGPYYSTCSSSHLRTKLVSGPVHVRLCGPGARSDLMSRRSYTPDSSLTVRLPVLAG